MKVAVAKYPVGQPRDFGAFADKQAALIAEAAQAGARLAVLPEYLSLELAATFGLPVLADMRASLAAIQQRHGDYMALFAALARQHGMHIVAGSFLLASGEARYRNRSYWFTPEGQHGWQDKLQLTAFEKKTGVIEGGDALKVFQADEVRAGIAICYDSEFPLPVRAQQEAGARLLVVPSCTDTAAGATRVQVACMARALENRMFVAQAVTTGLSAWGPALDANSGEAAIHAPMDVGLPADAVVVRSMGSQVWAVAELDFAALAAGARRGQVAVDRDWEGQLRPGILRARVERMSSAA
ncbi:MAG TPA: carbon-nitrogen hydrolase family protein [Stenotrophomonas sp.]|nr:carbon-nitrogen hydrolase family protein [Stenotrophomonas sp.]